MAPFQMNRPNTRRLSALALATLSLASLTAPSAAQTIYREYEDGGLDPWSDDEIRDRSAAPLRRPPPRAFDEEDDDRFEREDADDDFDDDDQDDGDRQGTLDLAPAPARKAPTPPPSIEAKPDDKAWKPAL